MIYLALISPVILGVFLAYTLTLNTKAIRLFLSFSGAYLLSITVLHLLPEVYESQKENIGLFILLGIVVQTTLEYFSRGAEHGHIHAHNFSDQIPWLLFISLGIHAFLEGMPLGFKDDTGLLWAIIIHKIPVAIILVVFLKKSNLPSTIIYLFLILFALMSPLGSFFAKKSSHIFEYQTEINAVIIGVFLHISTAILFESSENHKFNFKKFIAISIGFLVAFLSS